MNIIDLKNVAAGDKNRGVKAREIKSNFAAKSVNILLEANSTLPLHKTPVDVIFYVIKGEGIVEISEEKQLVKEGMFIDSPKDIPHAWHNESDAPLSVLVIKLFSEK